MKVTRSESIRPFCSGDQFSAENSNDSSLQCFHHCFGAIFRVELLIDVRDMIAERAHADLKLLSRFLRALTSAQKTQDLFLL